MAKCGKFGNFYGKICQFLRQNLAKFRISNGNFLRCQIILTSTQPVGSGRPQRESNSGPSRQESRILKPEEWRELEDRLFCSFRAGFTSVGGDRKGVFSFSIPFILCLECRYYFSKCELHFQLLLKVLLLFYSLKR